MGNCDTAVGTVQALRVLEVLTPSTATGLGSTASLAVPLEVRVRPAPSVPVVIGFTRVAGSDGLGTTLDMPASVTLDPATAFRGPYSTTNAAVLALATAMEGHPDNAAPALLGGVTVAWSDDTVHAVRVPVHPGIVPVAIVPVETVRESDGLALSSRNRLLTAEQRAVAPLIYQALSAARQALEAGKTPVEARTEALRLVSGVPEMTVQYLEIADAAAMTPVDRKTGPVRVAAAVWVGKVRLIDNVLVP